MKIAASVLLLGLSMNAFATYYELVSCEYKYIPEMSKSMYVGVYKSQYGNSFTKMTTSYCAASINQ